jgi:rubrerythrin
VSSRAEKRRRDFRQRQLKREEAIRKRENWECRYCGAPVPGWSPICLCGHVRDSE